MLCYVNNGSVSTIKGGKAAVYLQNFVLGQLAIAANGPENIDSYECKKIRSSYSFHQIYGTANKKFLGLTKQLAYMILTGTQKMHFSIWFTTKKSTFLYSFCKEKSPNVITSTAFKKHLNEILNERRISGEFSTLFYYSSSITDDT